MRKSSMANAKPPECNNDLQSADTISQASFVQSDKHERAVSGSLNKLVCDGDKPDVTAVNSFQTELVFVSHPPVALLIALNKTALVSSDELYAAAVYSDVICSNGSHESAVVSEAGGSCVTTAHKCESVTPVNELRLVEYSDTESSEYVPPSEDEDDLDSPWIPRIEVKKK